VEEAGFEPTYS